MSVPSLSEMTLREKINQTIVVLMERGKEIDFAPGAAFFFGQIITEADDAGLDELRGYVQRLSDKCKIPPLITSDFENGCGSMVKALTPLPFMMGLGATNNAETAYQYGRVTALEARSIGANWTFSPVSDLNRNRRNPLVNNRCMTDNTELAIKMLPKSCAVCRITVFRPVPSISPVTAWIIATSTSLPPTTPAKWRTGEPPTARSFPR